MKHRLKNKDQLQTCLGLWPGLSGTTHPSSAHHEHGSPSWCFQVKHCPGFADANCCCCLQMAVEHYAISEELAAPKKLQEAAMKKSGSVPHLRKPLEPHPLYRAEQQVLLSISSLERPLQVRLVLPAVLSTALSSAAMHKGDASRSPRLGHLLPQAGFFLCWLGCWQHLPSLAAEYVGFR